MSEIKVETVTMPAAELGMENPLPPIGRPADLHASVKTDSTVGEDDLLHLGWGQPPGMLPYRIQDGYNRGRNLRGFKAVVLENEFLRAMFLPELGGRLWSLTAKDTGRELLSRNPVFQPCNLAIRNAWLSGGVEWNLGWTGHWPLTCSPLFAALHKLPDGTPALRMWEWERVRKMPMQMDAWLPDGSRVLLVRISIHNQNPCETPVYWWSNIATDQSRDCRVVVSADDALLYNYATNAIGRVPLPDFKGEEITYPGRERGSRDSFFRVPEEVRQPWIASLDAGGEGLFQTSTSRLRGRKLFRWGIQTGGENWQRYLGTPDYIEIQAGLARTQSHHLPMPAGATWSWVEAYGCMKADPAAVHGSDWQAARAAAAAEVEAAIPGEKLEEILRESDVWASRPATTSVLSGSGWGALEALARHGGSLPGLGLPGIAFPECSIGAGQAHWKAVLDGGVMPECDANDEPGEFAACDPWLSMLERSISSPGGRHWRSLMHLGVMFWEAGRLDDAVRAWEDSCSASENPWARRCIGIAALVGGRNEEAVAHLMRAVQTLPGLRPLVVETLSAMMLVEQNKDALALIESLAPPLRNDGRIRLMECRLMLATGDLDGAERILDDATMPVDMREGEPAFSEAWFDLQAHREALRSGRPFDDALRAEIERTLMPPSRLDYRMWGVVEPDAWAAAKREDAG